MQARSTQAVAPAIAQTAAARKAVTGSGAITSPAVAAHLRRKSADTAGRAPQEQAAARRAVIGSGAITVPGVAAHARRKATDVDRTARDAG